LQQKTNLEAIKHDAIYKMGRNIILFQLMEQLGKKIVAFSSLAGTAETLQGNAEKNKAAVSMHTLGMIVGQMLDQKLANDEMPTPPKRGIAIKLTLELSKETESEIKDLVFQRNKLVHHFYSELDPESVESWGKAVKYLDHQRSRIVEVNKFLQSVINSAGEAIGASKD
jgi:uncharacterized protein YutE (UPF0331/DUF86 family)